MQLSESEKKLDDFPEHLDTKYGKDFEDLVLASMFVNQEFRSELTEKEIDFQFRS